MNKYVPKVGDKVKATLGENVLTGEVVAIAAENLVDLLVYEDEEVCLSAGYWLFEQIMSVPTKFGAVIRRADGQVYSYSALRQKSCPWLGDDSDGWVSERYATQGGFTVLFEGVDE